MKKYIVTLVSDWDDNRFHVENVVANNETQAHTILNMFKSKCEKSFAEDEQYFVEEGENYYFATYGTEDEPDTSVGWEKCVITEVEYNN